MKKNIFAASYQPLSRQDLHELTREVKETLDVQPVTENRKALTAAGLWNIQRRYKTSLGMRRYL